MKLFLIILSDVQIKIKNKKVKNKRYDLKTLKTTKILKGSFRFYILNIV